MNITFLGHAGLFIETVDCKIICDPWHHKNPAFFDSWYVYPDNSALNWEEYLASANFLYISHTHQDHLDMPLLKDLCGKNSDVVVILPDYNKLALRNRLEAIGFRNFIVGEHKHGKTSLVTYVSETNDREREDSELLVDDGNVTLLNVNDSTVLPDHKKDIFERFDKIDILACQFSGASFYPLSYRYDKDKMERLCAKHRSRTTKRFLRVREELGAKKTVLIAGPPSFLGDGMTHLNFYGDNPSIFPDGWQVEEFDKDDSIYRLLPGDVFSYDTLVDRKQPLDKKSFVENNIRPSKYDISITKEEYQTAKAKFLEGCVNLMKASRWLARQIAEKVYLSIDDYESFQFHFKSGVVKQEPLNRSGNYYILHMPSRIFHELVETKSTDWEDALLSCRCKLERNPDRYNPHILGFFRNMSAEQQLDIRNNFLKKIDIRETMMVEGREVLRYCPHQKYDLMYHSKIDLKSNTITCLGHGWTWDLSSGEGVNVTCPLVCKEEIL